MDYTDLLRKPICSLPVYQPGKPAETLARELGIPVDGMIKLASNENPFGASPRALEACQKSLSSSCLYPDNSGHTLVEALSVKHSLSENSFALGAGSNEIFYRLCDLFVEPGVEVVMGRHAFISYKIATLLAGGTPVEVPMPDLVHDLPAMLDSITEKTRLIFLPNPNNPTGTHLPSAEVAAFIDRIPDHCIFCYDEAYCEFQSDPLDIRPWIQKGVPIIATRTFSKIHGLAGLRIGYGFGEEGLIELINRVRPPFNTSIPAQEAALAAIEDLEWIEQSLAGNKAGLEQLKGGFEELGVEIWPSESNFVLIRVNGAQSIFSRLQESGIIVRPVAGYGLPDHLRISVGTEEQNKRLLAVMKTLLSSSASH